MMPRGLKLVLLFATAVVIIAGAIITVSTIRLSSEADLIEQDVKKYVSDHNTSPRSFDDLAPYTSSKLSPSQRSEMFFLSCDNEGDNADCFMSSKSNVLVMRSWNCKLVKD